MDPVRSSRVPSRARAARAAIERFFVPDQLLPDGSVDEAVVQRRYRRMVGSVAVASVLIFVVSLPFAGAPTELWLPFAAGVALVAGIIAVALLVVPRGSPWALAAAATMVISAILLDRLIGEYYHEPQLLVALLVAGTTAILGLPPALVAVVLGAVLLPVPAPPHAGIRLTDHLFALLYLGAVAAVVWTYTRLHERGMHALRAVEERFRETIERVPSTVYAAEPGPDGRWLYVSPRVESLLGYPTTAWTDDPGFWWSRLHPDDRERVGAFEARYLEHFVRPEDLMTYRMIARDGSVRWVSDDASYIVPSDGSAPYWNGTLSDVTERKALEAQLLEAQRMEAVGQLAGGIAHDFNNNLTAIRGYAEMTVNGLTADDPRREDLAEIISGCDRAAGLTRQLLMFSSRQILRPAVVDPRAVLDGIVPMLRRTLGGSIDVVLDLGSSDGWVDVDRSQLEQVVVNLALNARDAMPDGGRLSIAVADIAIPAREPGTRSLPPGDYVRLTVSDTGHGMDETTRARVFEPFFTTKGLGRGTGLGLATVYGVVRQSGGMIECASVPGQGTSFTIELPRVAPGDIDRAADAPDGEAPMGGETILLVDDEAPVRTITHRTLEGLGYTVLDAGSGAEAIDVAASWTDRIDLLLTDVRMPRMQGPELASRLCAARPDVRVLLMSGYAADEEVDPADRCRGAFIAKPFDRRQIADAVRRALDLASDEATLDAAGRERSATASATDGTARA